VAAGDTEGITNIDLVRIREKLGARAKRDQVASHGFEDTETAAIADLWALASDHAQDVVDEYPALASMLGLRQPGGRPRGRGVRVMARRKRHSETAVPTTQEPDWDPAWRRRSGRPKRSTSTPTASNSAGSTASRSCS
jgi:hypothetical protein